MRARRGRRAVLAGLAAGAAATAACVAPAQPPAPVSAPQTAPEPLPPVVEAPPIAVIEVAPGAQVLMTPPVPKKLGPAGLTQPVWSTDGTRVLYYDQPSPDRGGTWSVHGESGEVRRERSEWGYYWTRAGLLATPRPSSRDTAVLHLASGKSWTLPVSGAVTFSNDGTLVAYSSGGLVVAGADNQGARRVTVPTGGSPVAWLPGLDGWPNARLLLSGRSNARADAAVGAEPTPSPSEGPLGPGSDLAVWAADVRDSRRSSATGVVQLARSKRLVGVLPSPDGRWMAHVQMWNSEPGENGLFVTRTDGGLRRRLPVMGSYRWTRDNRLLLLPVRGEVGESHTLWEVRPESGSLRRLTDPTVTPFRVANYDWDVSPDGTQLVYVSSEDKGLWSMRIPASGEGADGGSPAQAAAPGAASTTGRPYRLPFESAPGPTGWYLSQWYGITTSGYRSRNGAYNQGQGIHFGIDFAAPMRTPVVALASGRIVAVDGDYGSPPHNVVLETAQKDHVVYGHLAERSRHVSVGQTVEAGQVVGLSGDSGAPYDGTRNPHLHLELRRGGRGVATNPVRYVDANWDDFSLGVWPGPQFQRNLDQPRSHQFIDEQPEIYFGGPIISNMARPWPP